MNCISNCCPFRFLSPTEIMCNVSSDILGEKTNIFSINIFQINITCHRFDENFDITYRYFLYLIF